MNHDLCIVGGAGHVGLPLGVVFANKGVKTILLDINHEALEKIKAGTFPFKEKNGDEELRKALKRSRLSVSSDPQVISESKFVLLVIGTPVDEYLNPDLNGFMRTVEKYLPYFGHGQILILRSTVYPGTSEMVRKLFSEREKRVGVAFCPERIVQGQALLELGRIPQIISAFDPITLSAVRRLFRKVVPKVIAVADPIEAELAKLISNAWRYVRFAVANQFYMIAKDHDLDYQRIYRAVVKDYLRMKDLPSPGFAAGPCLFKDTMQLAAFNNNNFFLGHSAMLINEGLPSYILGQLRKSGSLKDKTVGILGMAFKADIDDPRDSLSYKLRKIARAEAKAVLCHDVYIKDPAFQPLEKVLEESDIVILAAPHREYKKINPRSFPGKIFVDVWGFWK